jgi:hypothetical protein
MGTTHGLKSHTCYINPKRPKSLQNRQDPEISSSPVHSIFDQTVEVPKMVKHDQRFHNTWLRANMLGMKKEVANYIFICLEC